MFVELARVNKVFAGRDRKGTPVAAARDVSLLVDKGEVLALLGPSGSGKTTLLRCIAGLESPDTGEISIDGRVVFSSERRVDVAPRDRNLGLVAQSYSLWPHMTVLANVRYGLVARKALARDRDERAKRALALVGCEHLQERYPHELSGGQQQRIALARALVYEPSLVLFDEPLSNLDASLRQQLRSYIREIQRTTGFTGVYVTHDQTEAMFVGTRVAVMSNGNLLQVGSPDELYSRPVSATVAGFLGATNTSTGTLVVNGDRWTFRSSELGDVDVSHRSRGDLTPGAPATLMTRPEELEVRSGDTSGISATVIDHLRLGPQDEIVVELAGRRRWLARGGRVERAFARGESVRLVVPEGATYVYPAAAETPAHG